MPANAFVTARRARVVSQSRARAGDEARDRAAVRAAAVTPSALPTSSRESKSRRGRGVRRPVDGGATVVFMEHDARRAEPAYEAYVDRASRCRSRRSRRRSRRGEQAASPALTCTASGACRSGTSEWSRADPPTREAFGRPARGRCWSASQGAGADWQEGALRGRRAGLGPGDDCADGAPGARVLAAQGVDGGIHRI